MPGDQEIRPGPGLGVGIDGRSGIAEAAIVDNQASQRQYFVVVGILTVAIPAVVVNLADAAPTAIAEQIGRLAEHGQAFGEPDGIVGDTVFACRS